MRNPSQWTKQDYFNITGHYPTDFKLTQVNCEDAGKLGHKSCGVFWAADLSTLWPMNLPRPGERRFKVGDCVTISPAANVLATEGVVTAVVEDYAWVSSRPDGVIYKLPVKWLHKALCKEESEPMKVSDINVRTLNGVTQYKWPEESDEHYGALSVALRRRYKNHHDFYKEVFGVSNKDAERAGWGPQYGDAFDSEYSPGWAKFLADHGITPPKVETKSIKDVLFPSESNETH